MHPRPTYLVCALALAGCGGEPGTSSGGMTDTTGSTSSSGSTGATSSGGSTSSTGDDPTTGVSTGTTGTATGLSTGTGTTDQGSSTSSTGTTGEPAGWALLDVNPASASHDQQVAPGDYLGKVAGFYFAHAT